MKDVPKIFGSMVFNDSTMKSMLPKDTYKLLKQTISEGKPLTIEVANVVANAMKVWSIEKGATHFSHWFQPMTGVTAEKRESFISPCSDDGIIMEFSGKELVRGEPDASSFPSGGLRCTFEARGYTAWDPTSNAFIKDDCLCIPTAFFSYSGQILDKKTPLLKSMAALNVQALRILHLFGDDDVKKVAPTLGVEQEYFLIDRHIYEKRPDIAFCGRSLIGAKPPKGQELEDHYYSSLNPRISAYMKDLNQELWRLGVLAKTQHTEAAPSQYELAEIYITANISADHNQLTMELMKSVAKKHGMECLLHEKPFQGITGSGKHNNWSLTTDTGVNLLSPGDTPYKNRRFLLFLVAVIKAVDDYAELLRVSAHGAGNDHRLGGAEAPPAIISIFLGDQLMEILTALETKAEYESKETTEMEIGVTTLPKFPKDTTDRNRTSPFAFTGDKFEFRMVGSSASVSGPNFVMNTIVADVLMQFADYLESQEDFKKALKSLIRDTIKSHKRIIFNDDNYGEKWIEEAKERGLLILPTTVDALPHFIMDKSVQLFSRHGVLEKAEITSRYEILVADYIKQINIEALTLIEMTEKEIIPAIFKYQSQIAQLILSKKALSEFAAKAQLEESILEKITCLGLQLSECVDKLKISMAKDKHYDEKIELAKFFRDNVIVQMKDLRQVIDALETIVAKEHWPYPTYAEMLYSVQ